MEQKYMNTHTGSVDTRDGWDYEDENGVMHNAVDEGGVVPVKWSEKDEYWVECDA